MSLTEEIGYEYEVEENTTIDHIKELHNDGIFIWVSGSGPTPSKNATYRILMEAKRCVPKYLENDCAGKTANQIMLIGIKDAVDCVRMPMRLYIICATSLGFEKGLKGKGTNAEYVKELFDSVIEKKCHVTEIRWSDGSYDLKKYIYSKNPDRVSAKALENKQSEKQLRFKEYIYRECLEKVITILEEEKISPTIIRKVKEVRPSTGNE